jgi:hypothetical protein
MQLMQLELPALAHSPTGQSMQSFWLCDPKTSVYLPARQSTVSASDESEEDVPENSNMRPQKR